MFLLGRCPYFRGVMNMHGVGCYTINSFPPACSDHHSHHSKTPELADCVGEHLRSTSRPPHRTSQPTSSTFVW